MAKHQKQQKPRRQRKVQVWVWRRDGDQIVYLILKRPQSWKSGEFWQPVTGSIESGESVRAAALREVQEETTLIGLKPVLRTRLSFKFGERKQFREHILACQVPAPGEPGGDVTISHEHAEFAWLPFEAALPKLHFATNRAGLGAVHALLLSDQTDNQ